MISGTFLLLSVLAVLFPSVFYHAHATTNYSDGDCTFTNLGNLTGKIDIASMNCSQCNMTDYKDMSDDEVDMKYGSPLMAIMTSFLLSKCMNPHTSRMQITRMSTDRRDKSARRLPASIVRLV
jgi:hypothetical protein